MPRSHTATLVGSQPPTAGRPRAFLALAPWPASERAPSRPSRRKPCKLSVASDVDDSVPPSTQCPVFQQPKRLLSCNLEQ